MPVTFNTQPQDSSAPVGQSHSFFVSVTVSGVASYQWLENGVEIDGETASVLSFPATESNSYTRIQVVVTDSSDNIGQLSDVAFAVSLSGGSTNMVRHGLVYNYDDNNFTWKDPAVEIETSPGVYDLFDVTFQNYGFTPGFQQRWSDYDGVAWSTVASGGANALRWSETFSVGRTKEIMQVANGNIYKADQLINRPGSLKRFYVTKTQIDLDDLVPAWTTDKIKYISQLIFHFQSDQRIVALRDSNFDLYVGWSRNLMDTPAWKAAITADLEDSNNGGDYKLDYRTSGRYLALSFDLTESSQLKMTGGDILAQEAGGR